MLCSEMPSFIIANESHRFILQHQISVYGLSVENVLLESESKNTAPAVALACLKIKQLDPDGILLILPSDHYFSNEIAFKTVINTLIAKLSDEDIGLMGVLPSHANTQYGYMDISEEGAVTQFIEKPNASEAESLIKRNNIAWNCGVVVVKASALYQALSICTPKLLNLVEDAFNNQSKLYDFNVTGEQYQKIQPESFDVAVLENYKGIKAQKYHHEWDDLGTWNSLISRRKKLGLKQFNIFSENNKSIILQADNIVLCDFDDVLFVANQDDLSDLSCLMGYLKHNDLLKLLDRIDVHRPWGQFKVLAQDTHYVVKHLIVFPHSQISLQSHSYRNENWVVIKGLAHVELEDEKRILRVGDSISIKPQQKHRLRNAQQEVLEIIEVQTGEILTEDDIVRYDDQYLRHLNHKKQGKNQ
ncbi:mannose-1-phosphate guanylyltransferase/mannose-6-phosphate isomerase [Oceaniserpentilla sp. 4NH20-0058]